MEEIMKEKIYVFDLGNVIVTPINTKFLYEKLDCLISYENFLSFFLYDKSVIDAHAGLISDKKHIQKLLDFSKSQKSIEEYKRIYYEAKGVFFPDTVDIIDQLIKQRKKVCLLSNLRKIDFEWFQSHFDVHKFYRLFLSYEMHLNKPDKDIYLKMIDTLQVNPNDIYFFDDIEKNVQAAKECGIQAFCVTGNTIKDIFYNQCEL